MKKSPTDDIVKNEDWQSKINFNSNLTRSEVSSLLNIEKEDNEAYGYFPFLLRHKEFFWKLGLKNIVWEWTQAIIVDHPNCHNLVVKVEKEWKVDDLKKEYENHSHIYDVWKKWLLDWNINNVRVPHVHSYLEERLFIMERVSWQSLYSKSLLGYFKKRLSEESFESLSNITDKQLREYLKANFRTDDSFLDMIVTDYSWDILSDLLWTSHNYRSQYKKSWWTDLSIAIEYLKAQWILHRDLHPWNVMITNSWEIYIIDFWRVQIL